MIHDGAAISLDTLDTPPKGIRYEQDFRGGTTISYHRLSPSLLFLIPFTAVWSGISMWGFYGTQISTGTFDLGKSLFGLSFLIGTIILVSLDTYLLIGKTRVTLDGGLGTVFVGVGPIGWTRRFNYRRDSLVTMRLTNISVNDVRQQGILVRTDGKDFVFGTMFSEEAKRFVAAAIMKAAGAS